MKTTLLSCLMFVFSFKTFSNVNRDSADFYLKNALSLKEDRQVFDADKSFKKAIEFNPEDVALRMTYGNFLVDEKKYYAAYDQFRSVHLLNENDKVALQKLTEVSFALFHWNDVIRYGNDLKISSSNFQMAFMLGRAYYETGDYKEAKEKLQMVISQDKSNQHAIQLLADVYNQTGKTKKALALYKMLASNDTGNANLYYTIAQLSSAAHNNKEAIIYYNLAIEKGFSQDTEFLHKMALSYLVVNYVKGAAILKELLAAKPDDVEIMWQLANAHFRHQQFSAAAELYEKIFCIEPTNYKALYKEGKCYQFNGESVYGKKICYAAYKFDKALAEQK